MKLKSTLLWVIFVIMLVDSSLYAMQDNAYDFDEQQRRATTSIQVKAILGRTETVLKLVKGSKCAGKSLYLKGVKKDLTSAMELVGSCLDLKGEGPQPLLAARIFTTRGKLCEEMADGFPEFSSQRVTLLVSSVWHLLLAYCVDGDRKAFKRSSKGVMSILDHPDPRLLNQPLDVMAQIFTVTRMIDELQVESSASLTHTAILERLKACWKMFRETSGSIYKDLTRPSFERNRSTRIRILPFLVCHGR